jgi:hypothetical protein
MSGYTTLAKKSVDVNVSYSTASISLTNANAQGPFGTALVSEMTPTGQATFVYGTNNILWSTGSHGTGAGVSTTSAVMSCTSGAENHSFSQIRLTRSNKYRAGQGGICRLTAAFTAGADDTMQLAGVGNDECGMFFAVSGSNSFGILHREASRKEIRSFSITSPPAGAATLTVTLEGSTKSVTINGGGSANQTSYQISQADYTQVGGGWHAESIDGTVYFTSMTPGPRGGTFSILNGASPIATTATVQAGTLPTQTFITQSSWNIDSLDGSGPSGFTIDKTKGNIYGVGYQYLGFGNPTFSVENPQTGLLVSCHMIERANTSTSVVLQNPGMYAMWGAYNSGSLASSVTVKGASASTFNEGLITKNIGTAFSISAVKSAISATEVPILTIRANTVFNGQSCYGEIDPFNLSVANDSGSSAAGKLLKIFIYKNMGLGGPVNFQHVDSTRSIASYDTAATSISSISGKTQLLKSLIIAANESLTLKLQDENFFVATGETLTFTAQRVSNDLDNAAVSVSWYENQ